MSSVNYSLKHKDKVKKDNPCSFEKPHRGKVEKMRK